MVRLLLAAALLRTSAGALQPSNLRVHGLTEREALGIDDPAPMLSWAFELSGAVDERGQAAPATTLEVHESPSNDAPLLWSQSITEGAAMALRYAGPELRGATRYHWTICTAQQACAESSFLTAPKGWHGAEWIAGRQLRSPVLDVTKTVKSATVAVTGLGSYELHLNGEKVGDAELDPGFSTNYTERVLYAVHDVTKAVAAAGKKGLVLGARVGAGKYSMSVSHSNTITADSVFALLVNLEVTYSDGSSSSLVSSEKWKTSQTPFVTEHIYHGETYDARLELSGWDQLEYSPPPANWSTAKVITPLLGPDVVLSPRLFPPIRVVKIVRPINVTQLLGHESPAPPARPTPPCPSNWFQSGDICKQMCPSSVQGRDHTGRCQCGKAPPNKACYDGAGFTCENGVCIIPTDSNVSSSWLYDLGNNYAGVPRITLPAGVAAGTKMTIAVTEYTAEAEVPGRGTSYGQQDQYIFSGKEKAGDVYRPTFIYHGFRYIRLDDYPGTAAEAATAVEGLFMHSDVAPHGNVTIGESTAEGKILAAVHASVVQTQACNIYSVPTDCPQREKRGCEC